MFWEAGTGICLFFLNTSFFFAYGRMELPIQADKPSRLVARPVRSAKRVRTKDKHHRRCKQRWWT